jgi:hypothetical protein
MSEAILPLLQYAFMAWGSSYRGTGTTIPLPHPFLVISSPHHSMLYNSAAETKPLNKIRINESQYFMANLM